MGSHHGIWGPIGSILPMGSIYPMGSIFLASARVPMNPGVQCDDEYNCFGPTIPNLYGITKLIIINIITIGIVVHIRTF